MESYLRRQESTMSVDMTRTIVQTRKTTTGTSQASLKRNVVRSTQVYYRQCYWSICNYSFNYTIFNFQITQTSIFYNSQCICQQAIEGEKMLLIRGLVLATRKLENHLVSRQLPQGSDPVCSSTYNLLGTNAVQQCAKRNCKILQYNSKGVFLACPSTQKSPERSQKAFSWREREIEYERRECEKSTMEEQELNCKKMREAKSANIFIVANHI